MNKNAIAIKKKKAVIDTRLTIAKKYLSTEVLLEFNPSNREAVAVIAPAAVSIFEAYHHAFSAMQLSSLGANADPDTNMYALMATIKDPRSNPFYEIYWTRIQVALDIAARSLRVSKMFSDASKEDDDNTLALLHALNVESVFSTIVECMMNYLDVNPATKRDLIDEVVHRYVAETSSIPYAIMKDYNG